MRVARPALAGAGAGMAVIYLTIWGAVAAFGASAVYGLVWAIRTGQLERFGEGAASIFDEEEPVGVPTDGFPGEAP